MLGLEQILSFSTENGFPPGRDRQAMTEYLQCLILQSIFRNTPVGKLSFIGGTSLRFFYHLPRFSEDLDFDNFGLSVEEFEVIIKKVLGDLEEQGFVVDSLVKIKGAFHCYVRFKNLLFKNKLSLHADEKILIKIDTTAQEFKVVPDRIFFNRYGIVEEVMVNPKDILMAQKTLALLERKNPKGRDFFDFTFLDGVTKPNLDYLNFKIGVKSLGELKEKIVNYCKGLDFEALTHDIAPFVFNQRDLDRVTKFKQYIEGWKV